MTPLNGNLLPKLHGSLIELSCMYGNELIGNQITFCNGIQWDRTIGNCVLTNNTRSSVCDFESITMCGWTDDHTSDYTWIRRNGAIGPIRTGPSHDHTIGIPLEGHYMLLESSYEHFNDSARLISPIYSANRNDMDCLKFFYHMYGMSVGSLIVYWKPVSIDLETVLSDKKFRKFETSGNQKNIWREAIIFLNEMHENYQLIFEGTSIGSHLGDIAIDDVGFVDSTACYNEHPTLTTEETGGVFDVQSCANRCNEAFDVTVAGGSRIKSGPGEGGYIMSCFCYTGCEINDNCCPDYQLICVSGASSETDNIDVTDSMSFGTAKVLYSEEATAIIQEESTTAKTTVGKFTRTAIIYGDSTTAKTTGRTTKNDENIAKETEMNVPIADLEVLKDRSSFWTYFWSIVITAVIIGSTFYGIYFKYYRKFYVTRDETEIRFMNCENEELLEFPNPSNVE